MEADSNLWELARRAKAVFINGESILDFARPLVPGMFYLGDMEHKKPKPLPQDWRAIVDASDEGVILFSFGTIANTSLMPLRLKEAFLTAFSKFPRYTILWRLEGEMPAGLGQQKHVKIVKWIPQRDLLFDPKLKLFITHGGYNSFLETSQAGVPMILVPLLADQHVNAKRAVQLRVGSTLNKFTATAKEIENAIQTTLTRDSFRANANSLSSRLKDRVVDNQVAAVRQIERLASGNRFWPTMKVAQRLNWVQYLCLDVSVVLLMALLLIARCVFAFVYFIWRNMQKNRKAGA